MMESPYLLTKVQVSTPSLEHLELPTLEDYATANLQDLQYNLDKKNVPEMKEVTITFPQRAWASLSMLPPPGLLAKRSRSAEEGDDRNDLDLHPFRLTADDVSAHELGDEIHTDGDALLFGSEPASLLDKIYTLLPTPENTSEWLSNKLSGTLASLFYQAKGAKHMHKKDMEAFRDQDHTKPFFKAFLSTQVGEELVQVYRKWVFLNGRCKPM
nr:uncharacterized protein LOC109173786 [Ipomoea trifida]